MKKLLGVSTVIGVIVMVMIIVAIAVTVFVYVSTYYKNDNEILFSGNITYKGIHNGFSAIYYFVLNNNTEISVFYDDYMSYNIGDYYEVR